MKITDKDKIKKMIQPVDDIINKDRKIISLVINYQRRGSMTIKDLALMIAKQSKQIENLTIQMNSQFAVVNKRLASLETEVENNTKIIKENRYMIKKAHPEMF